MAWQSRLQMRLVVLLLALVVACGPKGNHGSPSGPPAVAKDYSAARWIPARPTYAIAARTVRDAQRAITDAVDSFGMLANVELSDATAALRKLLVVDILSPEALRQIGVDVDGGFAVFSDSLSPTIVVHLASPEQARGWLEDQRGQGDTTSELVGDVEIFGAKVIKGIRIHWAIDRDWMWIHFTIGKPEGTTWFTKSRTPGAPEWTADFEWAKRSGDQKAGGEPTLVGFVDITALLARLSMKVEDAGTCAKPLRAITRAGFAVEASPKHAALRFALELGILAPIVKQAILPAPEGWQSASANAGLSAQWNLDLTAVKQWMAPCARVAGFDLNILDRFQGVRSARMFISSFDPAAKEGSGAAAFDLTNKRYFQRLLDDIPMRSGFESAKQYGPYEGRRLAAPLVPALEYVLTDQLALGAFGDGLLARIVGKGGTTQGPLLAVDIKPAVLSVDAWAFLIRRLRLDNPNRIAERLVAWRDGHLAVKLDGSRMVFEARGSRP